MERYILGLDIGETSLGWACIRLNDNAEPIALLDAGVRIFPAAIERSNTSSQQINRNEERRAKRSRRRAQARRAARKERLRGQLQEAGLLPLDEAELANVMTWEPYELRARALDDRLAEQELGRALFHLGQRRGFKSNRKGGEKTRADVGVVAEDIAEQRLAIEQTGARTFGQMLFRKAQAAPAKLVSGQLRLRDRHVSRAMVQDEFDKIWDAQARHDRDRLDDALRRKLHDTLFFQRPFALDEQRRETLERNWRSRPVGRRGPRPNALRAPQLAPCGLIPAQRRGRKACWAGQQFRMLKELADLRVRQGCGTRDLTEQERRRLAAALSVTPRLTFAGMRRILGLPENAGFNLEVGKRNGLRGNAVEAALFGAFGEKRWFALADALRQQYRRELVEIDDHERIAARAREWGLDERGVARIADFLPEDGYMSLSERAMEILIPYLEGGLDEHYSIEQARQDGKLPRQPLQAAQDALPFPAEIPNPNVMRCLRETRKVVNALIREHGKPEKIVVELARGLKQNRDQRERAMRIDRDNEAARQEAFAWFKRQGRRAPSRSDILKWRLWSEQGGRCLYSGALISAEDLLSGEDAVEVDHILPYSHSLDNSLANQVLCLRQANRDKGDRTPYQWLGGPDSPRYNDMLASARGRNLSPGKLRRLQQEQVDIEEVVKHKLVDTRYASRQIAAYLALLYPPQERVGEQRVLTTPGGATAELRRLWGLDGILGADPQTKQRTDHRHHAVDAVAIACTTRTHVKRLAEHHSASQRARKRKPRPAFPKPWKTFTEDVDQFVTKREQTWKLGGREAVTRGIIVSHRVDRRICGGLHEETNYGITKEPGQFVYRVDLTRLTGSAITKIRDRRVREIVTKHVKAQGFDPEKQGSKTFPAAVWQALPQLPVSDKQRARNPALPASIPINSVRVLKHIEAPLLLKDAAGKPYRAVISGNNHHVEIIEIVDRIGRRRWEGAFVPMIEAARRVRRLKQAGVLRDHGDSKRFIMSLVRNDSVLLKVDGEWAPYRLQKMSVTGQIVFRPLNQAGIPKNSDKPPAVIRKSPPTLMDQTIKVSIDPLGRIGAAND